MCLSLLTNPARKSNKSSLGAFMCEVCNFAFCWCPHAKIDLRSLKTMIFRQILPFKKEGGEHVVLTWGNEVWFGTCTGGETPGLTGTRSRWPSPTSGWGRQGSLTAGRSPPPTLPSSSGQQLTLHCKENPIYVFPEKELPVLSPNFLIHVTVSDLYIPNPYSSDQLTWGHPQEDQCWGICK